MQLGFHLLDAQIKAIEVGDLTVVGGATGTGTGALLANILRHAALNEGLNVAYYTPQVLKEQEVTRMLAMLSGVSLASLKKATLKEEEKVRLLSAAKQLETAGIWIDDASQHRPVTIREQVQRLRQEHPISAVFVGSPPLGDARPFDELKRIAEDLEVSVIAHAPGFPPLSSPSGDVRGDLDLSAFEEADHVVGLLAKRSERGHVPQALLRLLKTRNGATADAVVQYFPDRGLFLDVLPDAEAPEVPALITTLNRKIKLRLSAQPERILSASPRIFEELMAEVFYSQGFEVELTAPTRDGGVDLIALKRHWPGENFRLLVECKRYRSDRPVGVEVVRGFSFLLEKHQADRAILATTSRFTSGAHAEVATPALWRVSLKEFDSIKEWLRDYHRWLLLH